MKKPENRLENDKFIKKDKVASRKSSNSKKKQILILEKDL